MYLSAYASDYASDYIRLINILFVIRIVKVSRPTISDVAKIAKVSTATVSHVINKTRYVSDELINRVNEAIEEIGYIPSSSARSLVTNTTHIIGVVFTQIVNPFYTSAFMGIEDEFSQLGIDIILANTGESKERQDSILKELISRNIDGLIIAPVENTPMLQKLQNIGMPFVLFDRSIEGIPSVTVDNENAAFKIVNHLFVDGHKKIGIISGLPTIDTSIKRVDGYKNAHRFNSVKIDEKLIYQGNSLRDGGYYGAKYLLSLNEPPTAIFSTNNLMTIGVLHYFKEKDIVCPNEISLVSFDDQEWADIFNPPITVMRQPTYEMGKKAAQMLTSIIDSKGEYDVNDYQEIFNCELIIRGSCSKTCNEKFAFSQRNSEKEI